VPADPKPSKKPKKVKDGVDKAHLDKVRQMPCIVCGRAGPSDPHHPKGVEWGCGTGLKAPDYTVIPLCRKCHQAYHDFGKKTFEATYGTHQSLLDKLNGI